MNTALERLRYQSERALGYEAGLHGSVRLMPGGAARAERVDRFRERLGDAAASMSDEQFEDFLAHLGGGEAANVEADRARVVDRMSTATRGIEEYFAIAGKALATLEERGYNPNRSDIARQLALSQIEPEKTESPFASLSERELQIMLMITKGQKVNEISEQLNLSPKTVNSYRYRMFSKLNIHGDVELTHLAIRHGLCNAESLASQ